MTTKTRKYHFRFPNIIVETEYCQEDCCEASYWSTYKDYDITPILVLFAMILLYLSEDC